MERADGLDHPHGAIAILDIGGMNIEPDKVAKRIGDDVTLATVDLLAGIESARPAGPGGFDRLAINHAGGRGGFAAGLFARHHDQRVVDPLKRAVAREPVKIALDRGERREFPWNLPP